MELHAVSHCLVKWLDSFILFPCCFYYLEVLCNTPFVCKVFLSSFSFSLSLCVCVSLSYAASLHLLHLLLASICLTCNCYLYFFFWPYWITLKRFWSDIKLYSYKAILGWHSRGKSLSSHLAFFFQHRGGRCLPPRTKHRWISFSKWIPNSSQEGFPIRHEKIRALSSCAVAQEHLNFLAEWGTTPAATGVGISRCRRTILPKIYVASRSAALVCASCCNLARGKLREFN